MNTEIPIRFCNVTGKIRWVIKLEGKVLEQEFYANKDEKGEFLQYPETQWFEVITVNNK